MRDRDLYAAILGVTPPWEVVDVDLDTPGQRVESSRGQTPCAAAGLNNGKVGIGGSLDGKRAGGASTACNQDLSEQ